MGGAVSMNRGVVVIGAGQAAAQLAISLRQAGYPDGITIIGEEPYPPYQRPPLSKKFLLDRGPPESLFPVSYTHLTLPTIYSV